MPTVAIYRCPKCRTEYRPLDAGARRFICCGVSLKRVNASSWKNPLRLEQEGRPSVVSPRPSATAAQLSKGTELIEVIPPRETMVDAPAVGMLLSAFSTGSPYSLEIAGDDKSRRFLVRGTLEGVAHIRRQLQATYD